MSMIESYLQNYPSQEQREAAGLVNDVAIVERLDAIRKDVHSISTGVTFFVVVAIIALVISIFGALGG